MKDLASRFTLELIAETLSVVLERVATLESDTPDWALHTEAAGVQCICRHTPFVKLMSVFLLFIGCVLS